MGRVKCSLQMVRSPTESRVGYLIYSQSLGGRTIRNSLELSGEPWQPQMMDYATATDLGTYDMWQVHQERTKLAKFYMDRWNSCEGLDAILSTIIPFPVL